MEEKPKTRKITLANAIIISFAVFVVGIGIGFGWNNVANQYLPYLGIRTSSNDWSSLNEVYDTLSSKYDGEVDFNTALEGAKKGIAASLGDVYTVYMSATEATDFNKSLHGDVGSGIGVVLAKRDGYIRIVRTLPDNPASKAGVLAGDIIYKIDDENVLNLDSDEIATRLRGADNTKVKLTIVRDGEEKSFELTREPINNVSAYIDYKDKTAIIHVTRFDTDTGTLVRGFTKDFSKRELTKSSWIFATMAAAMSLQPKTSLVSG